MRRKFEKNAKVDMWFVHYAKCPTELYSEKTRREEEEK